jgi:hypothetical protein
MMMMMISSSSHELHLQFTVFMRGEIFLRMIDVLKGRKLAATSTLGNQADQAPQTLHNPSLQLFSTPDPD